MIFKIPEVYFETIRQGNTSELSPNGLEPSKFESKSSHAAVMMCRQGHCNQNGKRAEWFNKTKCVQRVQ
jgi:hypothetical protein